jgi:hypothetical protein
MLTDEELAKLKEESTDNDNFLTKLNMWND